jgi:hypothetical protein
MVKGYLNFQKKAIKSDQFTASLSLPGLVGRVFAGF